MDKDFFFIGHRGTRTDLDENTLLAFNKSLEFGANYIEFDVRKTKDEQLVILHDPTLDRTTVGKGNLRRFTYKELKNFKTIIDYTYIPLLSEVLKKLKGKIKFIIEVKDENISNKIVRIIKDLGVFGDSILSGRNLKDLDCIKKNYPHIITCFNITYGSGLTLREFMNLSRENNLNYNFDIVCLRSNLVSKEFVEVCQRNKIRSLAWNFLNYNDPINKIITLIRLGINGILFDNHQNIPLIKKWFKFN